MERFKWIDMLSIRPGWGMVGNAPTRDYLFINKYASGRTYLYQTAMNPDGLKLTFDVYWGVNAGIDPAKFIQTHEGRVYCTHLKDMAVSDKGEIIMKECLDGNINFDPVIEMSKKCGVEYHLVEQDNTYGLDPFESLKISHDNLKSRYDFR